MLSIVGFALSLAIAAQSPDSSQHATASSANAASVVDTAIARMGGLPALQAIKIARYHLAIQWLNPSFDPRPYRDGPSYEFDTDYRDYDARIWRNTRRFARGGDWLTYLDLVVDTVAARQGPNLTKSIPTPAGVVDGWAPLDIAYIDERRELFALTPDRLVLALKNAHDLTSRADTIIGGIRHASVSATVEGYPMTAFFRQADGMLALARYHADESNDYGLAPWGPMDVEVWYSVWQRDGDGGVYLPHQWDIARVGHAYKRMSVLDVAFDSAMSADSLTLSAPVRAAYLELARKPMADLPLDSARISTDGRIALFNTPGAPRAAVKVGAEWFLLEPGNLPLNAERAAGWLAEHDKGSRVAGAMISREWPMGGAAWVARAKLPIYLAPSDAQGLRTSLSNFGAPVAAMHVVSVGQWIRTSSSPRDSAWVEPIDVPGALHAMLIYVPSMKWVYSSGILSKVDQEFVERHIAARKWSVERIGSLQLPAGTPAGGVSSAR
ncbi:MAG TPA: hypothetical protein VGO46_18660 [Gemmatimonadaceae bacterium]|nr:hypothetical protein [Gemmatimonadaceae bacterium]